MRTALLTLPLLACACTSRLVLMAPLTAPASSYDCSSATDAATCTPATVLDPAEDTVSGAATIVLPAECQGSIDSVVLRNRGSSSRDAVATCGSAAPTPGTFVCKPVPDDWQYSVNGAPPCTAESAPDTTGGLALALPTPCSGLANQIIIDKLRSGTPRSTVTCAAPENTPGTTP